MQPENFEARIEGKERHGVSGGRAAIDIGKRELSVILLVFGVIISVYMALLAGPISAQNGDNDVTNGNLTVVEDVIIDDQFIEDEITVFEDDDNLREDVIIDKPNNREPTVINIPNKPLPPTGGFPVYGMIAGSILAGAGLLGLGIGVRRGQRR